MSDKINKINKELKVFINESSFISTKCRNKLLKIFCEVFSVDLDIGNYLNVDLSKNKVVKYISYFAIFLPIYDLIQYFDFSIYYKLVGESILVLYCTYLVTHLLCKDDTTKNVFGTIGIVLSLYELIYTSSYIVGIYVGIIGLGAILIGCFVKNRKPIFISGIVITIANILIQLNNLWDEIPFWLYLLIGGLTLIGIVTYKEINKNKEK